MLAIAGLHYQPEPNRVANQLLLQIHKQSFLPISRPFSDRLLAITGAQLTHVAWCHLEVAATGVLTPAWDASYWKSVPELVGHIHQSATWTRVLLTVAIDGHEYDPNENKTTFLRNHSGAWPRFLEALAGRIHEADADGVIFDIEHIDKIPGGLDDYAALVLQTARYLGGIPRPAGRPQLQTMIWYLHKQSAVVCDFCVCFDRVLVVPAPRSTPACSTCAMRI